MNKRLSILTTAALFLSTALVIFISCSKDDDATPDPVMVATSIELVSGNEQTAEVLAALANPVVIVVRDQNGDAIAGSTVSFTVSEGSVSKATATTSENGNASVLWTLGGTIGTQTLEATIEGLANSPIIFSAIGSQITVTDIDGNLYNAVVIGDQVWMVENLKTTKYNDGTDIPLVTDNTDWSNLTTPAYCWLKNDETTYKNTYGALYNWHTVNTGNLCPAGWHVPTDAEWTTMEDYLIANGYNFDSSITGNKIAKSLASTTIWTSSTTVGAVGNTDYPTFRNKTDFTALPGGVRTVIGLFSPIDCYGDWWSATEYDAVSAWYRGLSYSDSYVERNSNSLKLGMSVRCVRD
jgi:uncharacterized protein (TIGR02145 family)